MRAISNVHAGRGFPSPLAYCHVFRIFMTDVDPVEFIQISQYFARSIFTRGRTFLIDGRVSYILWEV